MKFARDPSNFYAAKLHNTLESGDTDTAGRIILTSTVVRLVFSCRPNPTACAVDEEEQYYSAPVVLRLQ